MDLNDQIEHNPFELKPIQIHMLASLEYVA